MKILMHLFAGQRWRRRHREQMEGVETVGRLGRVYTQRTCETDGRREAALHHRELSPMLCDDLGGEGGVEGRLKRERVHAYITADSRCCPAEANATL